MDVLNWLFRIGLITVLVILVMLLITIGLVKLYNKERMAEQPIPPAKMPPPMAVINNQALIEHQQKIKHESNNFIKSGIWPEYLKYIKTGERINPQDAAAVWKSDNEKYKSEFSLGDFSIVSWNVKCFYGGDEIAKTLSTLNVDVICFQEYSNRHTPAIAEQLAKYPHKIVVMIPLGPSPEDGTMGFGNAIYSKHPLSNIKTVDLRDINDLDDENGGYSNERRIAISADVTTPAGTTQIITTHLTVGDSTTDNLRLLETNKLLSMIKLKNCIICGDFNSGIDAGEKVHEIMNNNLTHMYDQSTRMFSSTSLYGGTIDHFYYKFAGMWILDVQIIFSQGSDHYPILANLVSLKAPDKN